MKRKAVILCLSFLSQSVLYAGIPRMTGGNYFLVKDVVETSGSPDSVTGGNYRVSQSVGEAGVKPISGGNFILNAGYLSKRVVFGIVTSTPTTPSYIYDGLSADVDAVFSTTTLSANWGAGTDNESGISGYWYCIGTSTADDNIEEWTYNSDITSVTVDGLSLTMDTTYYFSVKAVNGAGRQSPVVSSDGVLPRSPVFDHYEVSVPSVAVIGQNFTMRIYAANSTNDTIPVFSGTVNLQAVMADNISNAGRGSLGLTTANLTNSVATLVYQNYTKAENIKIRAIDADSRTGLSDILRVAAGVPEELTASANPGSIISGQTSLITAVVNDVYGSPIENSPVIFTVIKGSGSVTESVVYTDTSGESETTFAQSLGRAEVNTIKVTAGSLTEDININVGVLIQSQDGGTIIASEDPKTQVYIPPTAINVNIQVQIIMQGDIDDDKKTKINAANQKNWGQIVSSVVREFKAIKESGEELSDFSDYVEIELPYQDDNDDGVEDTISVPVEDLKVCCLNESDLKWEIVGNGGKDCVDETDKVVKGKSKHFSIYSIGAMAPANNLSAVVVYPNPVNFSTSVRGTVKFENLMADSRIKIFNLKGKLVKTLNPDTLANDGSSGKAEWDGKNEDGETVGFGLYLYHITSGSQKTTGKIAVVK